MIRIHPLGGIGEILPGCALGTTLADALAATMPDLGPDDVLVVTSKIVSKAEGCFADLATVQPGAEAVELAEKVRKDARLVQLVLDESVGVVRAAPHVLITRHRTGHVMANAGIDRSNLGRDGDFALLLPTDPDKSAATLREALATRWPQPPAVVISDSFGRPWRYGTTNVAIGASGFPSLLDKRGEPDRDGRPLEVTQLALGDMIAGAAGLAMGEGAEGIPAALVRGFQWSSPARPAADLIRPLSEDLFR